MSKSTDNSRFPVFFFPVLALVTLTGLIIRYLGRDYVSGDFRDCLLPWYEDILSAGDGIGALKAYKGDYAIPYVFLTWVIGKLPIPYLYSVKLLSVVFDVIMAISAGLIAWKMTGKSFNSLLFGYSVVFLLPNAIIDSTVWGQCDSLYTAFILIMFYFFLNERYMPMMFFFGIALSFKLQAVFILPFLMIIYWFGKKFSVLTFAMVPLAMVFCNIPAYLAGFPFSITYSQYVSQTGTYPWLYYYYPNLYFFFQARPYYFFSTASVCFAVTALLIFVLLMRKNKMPLTPENSLTIAVWVCYTCVFMLPSMHERYGYLAEALAVILAIVKWSRDKRYVLLPIGMIAATLPRFLFANSVGSGSLMQQGICAVINTVTYGVFSYSLWKILNGEKPENA